MPRSTLFAYMIFIQNTEINESYKLCHVRDKHTVGGIVFYKHLFLVTHDSSCEEKNNFKFSVKSLNLCGPFVGGVSMQSHWLSYGRGVLVMWLLPD